MIQDLLETTWALALPPGSGKRSSHFHLLRPRQGKARGCAWQWQMKCLQRNTQCQRTLSTRIRAITSTQMWAFGESRTVLDVSITPDTFLATILGWRVSASPLVGSEVNPAGLSAGYSLGPGTPDTIYWTGRKTTDVLSLLVTFAD